MAKASLCADASGVLRGECRRCKNCPAFGLEKVHRLSLTPGDSSADTEQMSAAEKRQAAESACHSCGCPAHQHWGLEDWWLNTRKWTQKFQDSNGMYAPLVADSFSLPAPAQHWDPEAAALYLVTHGQFDPRRDGRRDEAGVAGRRDDALVSVICTSIEKNHPSHPLLYECFQRQTYSPRELVVIDTGTQPSKFMQQKAKADPRVTYRFFFREEHGLEQEEDSLEHVMNEDTPEEVLQFVTWTPDFAEKFDANRAEVPCQGLTLGVKRNIAVHLSRGSMLMHFNIGDVYCRDYLACMRSELLALAFQPSSGYLPPAAISLGNWHAVDLTSRDFRRLDLQERGHHLPEEMKRSLQCARGFTYAYTRKTWEAATFPNTEHPEGHLMKVFQRSRIPFKMVTPMSSTSGLAARGYDKAHITGGSVAASMNNAIEIRDLVDCSSPCDIPTAFRELLTSVEDMSSAMRQIRDGRINELLEASGAAFFCVHCDAAVALKQYLKEVKAYGDGAGGSVELAQFSRAGGAVAEGKDHPEAMGKQTQVGRIPRSRLTCASPGCSHRVHSDLDVGGYCCVVCYLSRGWQHGPRCERAETQFVNHRADGCSVPRDAGPPMPIEPPPAKPDLPEPVVSPPSARVPLVMPKPQQRPLAQQMKLSNEVWQNKFQPLKTPECFRGPKPSVLGNLKPMLHLPGPNFAPLRRDVAQNQRSNMPPVVERRPPREPEPVQITWFPGWSWRNALCRHCGKAIGWRYEKEGGSTIFWALEQRHLVERLPPVTNRAVPVKIPVKQETTFEATKKAQAAAKAAAAEIAAAEAAAARAAEAAAAEAAAAAAPAAAAPTPAAAPEVPPAAVKAAEEDQGALDVGRKAVECFSLELRKQLASSLKNSSDKFCVDQALGALRLDEPTRTNLRKELEIEPRMAAMQADIWIAKCFRGKVYALRKLDFKVLCKVLEEAASDVAPTKEDDKAPSTEPSASTASSSSAKENKAPSPAPQVSTASSSSAKEEEEEGAPSTEVQASSSSSSAAKELPVKAETSTTGGDRKPAKDKADKATNAGSQVICSFSPELQRQLASGVAGSDGSGFDQVLNGLKLDDTTRENLRKDLMIRPGVNPLQVEQLIAKAFRGKVNTLRSMGLRKLRGALEQALPEGVAA